MFLHSSKYLGEDNSKSDGEDLELASSSDDVRVGLKHLSLYYSF